MLKLQSRLGDLELIRPGRELVKEGELQKISRKGVGPRYFVLLSDCLLYCTYAGSWSGDSTSLRVTYKIPLASLQVRVSGTAEADYQNEFNITSPVRSCTLRAGSVSERNDWLDALNSAVEEHVSRKATFSAASTAGGLSNGNGSCDNNGGSIVVGLHQQSELKIGKSCNCNLYTILLCNFYLNFKLNYTLYCVRKVGRDPPTCPSTIKPFGNFFIFSLFGSNLDPRPPRHNVPELRSRVQRSRTSPSLPRLRESCLRDVLGQQGAASVQGIRGRQGLRRVLRTH
jgi:hypothetical protein